MRYSQRCRSAAQLCVDDESVQICEDEIWTVASCEEICAELGPAWVADGCEDGCVCAPADPNGCTPGERVCADEETVSTCSDAQVWENASCEELCAVEGLSSAGCMEGDEMWMKPDACWCTTEGTACEEGAAANCVNDQTLANCQGGVWVFEGCASSCGGSGSCDPFAEVEGCSCS